MSTNPKSIYNEFIRANLPVGITYDEARAQYVTGNGKRFPTYLQAKWYLDYIIKFGYSPFSSYSVLGFEPPLVLDFIEDYYRTGGSDSTFDDALNFSRASAATYTDADGVLQTAAAGVPRVGNHVYNGSEWVNEGLLLESEARTNLVTASNDFTSAGGYWSSGGNAEAIALTTDTTSPTGAADAYALIAKSTGGTGVVSSFTGNVSVGTSTTYTYSEYFKRGGVDWVQIAIASFTTPADGGCYFDLLNGVVGTADSGLTGEIESAGNGWYRCSIAFTTDAADVGGTIVKRLADAEGDNVVALDGTSYIYNFGAQLEEGSTPSSYIPTSGSTVTRTADAMTIPAANLPWPTPEVIGPELVTNGTFDTDTDWTLGAGWTISGGQLVATSATGSASQLMSLTGGKVYQLSVENTANIQIRIVGGTGQSLGYYSGADANRVFTFTAGAGVILEIVANGTTTGSIDNISVREINPLAVSIQMEGTMTYADVDTFSTVSFTSWFLDGNNSIVTRLDTNATNEGKVLFGQTALGVNDFVQDLTAYTPGINVPFNIASRHGSTFINGAVDGPALTANLTPTALPDLSATDLNLGFDFMGTIKLFRVWADDLTDEGIEEGSSNV